MPRDEASAGLDLHCFSVETDMSMAAVADQTSEEMQRQASAPLPPEHPAVQPRRIAVLLVNLGTPDGTDYWSMRRYLKEFLSDRRVIDVNRLLWWPLLNGIILTTRPSKSGRAYASIWNNERDESPLRTITRSQAERLAATFAADHPEITVDWAMRYGTPSIPDAIKRLQAQGADRIVMMPLYPQYAASTTATVCDKAFDTLKTMRWQPSLRVVPPYFDDPAYIDGLARSIRAHLDGLSWGPQLILTSFHGVPKRYLMLGDPYHCHCAKTSRLLREALGLTPQQLRLTFQSRFGTEEWLQPYTDKTLEALPAEGIKRVAILAPGFVADCLETLEELNVEGRESFLEAGGEQFAYIPCLNDSDDGMQVIETMVRRELAGWIAR